jgi:rubrerythrin
MDATINADYLLRMAERVERNGADFYQMAATYVQETAAAQLLLQLAAMEARHEQIFAAMRSRLEDGQQNLELDPRSETAMYLKGLLAGKFFDIRTGPGDYLRGSDSVRDILLTAIGLEKETIAFYEGVKRVLRPEDAPAVEAVLREEMRHVSQLAGALER